MSSFANSEPTVPARPPLGFSRRSFLNKGTTATVGMGLTASGRPWPLPSRPTRRSNKPEAIG